MTKQAEQLDSQVPDILGMSEDELSKLDISQYLEPQTTAEPDPEDTNTGTDPEDDPEPEDDPVDETETPDPEDGEQLDNPDTELEPGTEIEQKPVAQKEPKGKTKDAPTDLKSQDVPDYKAFHDQILGKPIRANGREITLSKPEDVIQLIQMGANYHEKMAALKPSRRILKMLEEHQLMDESEIGFLIDLKKKNPQAIAKLIKDSNIDLMEFDPEQDKGYTPEHKAPSEADITLADTIQEMQQSSATFKDTFTAVTSWDVDSQNTVAQHPSILRILDQHKANGVFDRITAEISRERVLGRLSGVSDFEAYRAIEAQLSQAGQLVPQQAPVQAPVNKVKKVDPDLANKKKAAATPRQTIQGKKTLGKDVNVFALSEEEFAKIDPTQFS